MLKAKGIAATQLDIAGHSWGTYVGYEVALQLRAGLQKVPRLIALDPAAFGAGYTKTGNGLQFKAVAKHAVAFYGEPQSLLGSIGRFGSSKHAVTAHDAFTMVGEDWGLFAAHGEPVNILADIFERFKAGENLVGDGPFSLAQFSQIAAGAPSPWNPPRDTRSKEGEIKPAGSSDKKKEYLFEGPFVIEGTATIDQYP